MTAPFRYTNQTMSKQTLKPSEAQWHSRLAKRLVDEHTYRAMHKWATAATSAKRVLSFPAAEWEFEKAYATVFPHALCEFVGVESDPDTHARMGVTAGLLEALHTGFKFSPQDAPVRMTDFMKRWKAEDQKPFDYIYLDWMGTWSEDKMRQVNFILDNGMLAKDGFFRFTLSMNRGHKKRWEVILPDFCFFDITDLRGGGSALPEWKLHGIPGYVIDRAEQNLRKAKLVSAATYLSSNKPVGRSTAEMSVLLRIK